MPMRCDVKVDDSWEYVVWYGKRTQVYLLLDGPIKYGYLGPQGLTLSSGTRWTNDVGNK